VVEVDGRKRHKRGRMMRGERSLVLVLVLEDFVLGGMWRKREGREGECFFNLDTLHLVGLGLGGLGNLWRFPGLGNTS